MIKVKGTFTAKQLELYACCDTMYIDYGSEPLQTKTSGRLIKMGDTIMFYLKKMPWELLTKNYVQVLVEGWEPGCATELGKKLGVTTKSRKVYTFDKSKVL